MGRYKSVYHLFTILLSVLILFSTLQFCAYADCDVGLTIGDVSAEPGNEICVPVSITAESNVSMLEFWLEYDSTKLILSSAKIGDILTHVSGGQVFISTSEIGKVFFQWDSTDSQITESGSILDITFSVDDEAKDSAVVSFDASEHIYLYDSSYQPIEANLRNGIVTVSNSVPLCGDVDLNGEVNVIDVNMLRRAAAGLMTLTEEQKNISDIYHDGRYNSLDVNLLRRYVAGYVLQIPYNQETVQ